MSEANTGDPGQSATRDGKAANILFISNGHGEDVIACRIIDALAAASRGTKHSIRAWPMVGHGAAYRQRGIACEGASNLLPSDGFATLDRRLMWRDLRAGWIATHWRQFHSALSLRGRYTLLVAVGDMVPVGAAILAATPFFFVGCAKSAYYNRAGSYSGFEKWLLRRYCLRVFPRDELTATEFDRADVANAYVGSPMMDGLELRAGGVSVPEGGLVIAVLPGSRSDAGRNAVNIAALIAASLPWQACTKPCFLFAMHDSFEPYELQELFAQGSQFQDWSVSTDSGVQSDDRIFMTATGPAGAQMRFAKGMFAEILHMSYLVIGMAGTANEQAIGLGKPVIALPSDGSQGEKYVRMKQDFFGPSAISIATVPEALTAAVETIAGDPDRYALMAKAGRERMGNPGASAAIAADILKFLNSSPGVE